MLLLPTLNWPIAVVVFTCVGLISVLVLYLIVRVRSNNRQLNSSANNGDDIHSQMEWEDDIGLNITVNPLDETKKPVQSVDIQNVINEYHGSSSDDDDEYENNTHHHHHHCNQCSSEDDDEDYTNDQIHAKKHGHQLEWDDAAIEYGPKRV